jgi:multimeric flavodoxin WrbA
MTRSFLFVLGSARREGNTELLARRAAEQLPADVEQQWIRLVDHPLPDFTDLRHDSDHVRPKKGSAALLLDATLTATDVVIASPLYWYSVSGHTKRYLDHWSGWMRAPGVDFRPRMAGRTLWGVTALSGRDVADADALVGTLRKTANYMKMEWGGVLTGNGTRPGDVLDDTAALSRAKEFFTG